MKKILTITIGLAIMLSLNACSKFLETNPDFAMGDTVAMEDLGGLQVGVTGLYQTIRNSIFLGRNYPGIGDIAADVTTRFYEENPASWLAAFELLDFTDGNVDIRDVWAQAYRAIDRAVRVINAGEKLLPNASTADRAAIQACLAQVYTIKALSLHILCNMYALPYTSDAFAQSTLGVVNIDKEPILPGQAIERATLYRNYQQILSDIEAAKTAWETAAPQTNFTRITKAATLALEARVKLYKRDFAGAITAAEAAIAARGGSGLVMDPETYVAMWATSTPSPEDIFTLTVGNATEALGTTSFATLFSTYGVRLQSNMVELIDPADMRFGLLNFSVGGGVAPLKYQHLNSVVGWHNIPVIRLPEMYLIIAEANNELATPNTTAAAEALLNIAKRNPAITTVADLPNTQTGLRQRIREERVRELFGEGHRFWDMRRTGELLSRSTANTKVPINIVDWDVSKFVFPIPIMEINATRLVQNEWYQNLPPGYR